MLHNSSKIRTGKIDTGKSKNHCGLKHLRHMNARTEYKDGTALTFLWELNVIKVIVIL
jgi:hypothetical protein